MKAIESKSKLILLVMVLLFSTRPAVANLSNYQDLLQGIVNKLQEQRQLRANFKQYNGDGEVSTGQVLMLKPHFLRLDYFPPDNITIVLRDQKIALIDYDLKQISYDYIKNQLLHLFFKPHYILSDNIKILTYKVADNLLILNCFDRVSELTAQVSFNISNGAITAIETVDANQQVIKIEVFDYDYNQQLQHEDFSIMRLKPK